MENPNPRMLIRAILFGLASGIAVLIAGTMLGWKSPTQFSDGFFWVGAIMLSIGLISVMGAQGERTVSGLETSQSAVHLDSGERFKIWAADISRSHRLLAFLGISGLLLLGMAGLSILVGRVF